VIWRNVYDWLEKFNRWRNNDVDGVYSGLRAPAACVEVTERINRLIRCNRGTKTHENASEISIRSAKLMKKIAQAPPQKKKLLSFNQEICKPSHQAH
jgi:hypothetical protein